MMKLRSVCRALVASCQVCALVSAVAVSGCAALDQRSSVLTALDAECSAPAMADGVQATHGRTRVQPRRGGGPGSRLQRELHETPENAVYEPIIIWLTHPQYVHEVEISGPPMESFDIYTPGNAAQGRPGDLAMFEDRVCVRSAGKRRTAPDGVVIHVGKRTDVLYLQVYRGTTRDTRVRRADGYYLKRVYTPARIREITLWGKATAAGSPPSVPPGLLISSRATALPAAVELLLTPDRRTQRGANDGQAHIDQVLAPTVRIGPHFSSEIIGEPPEAVTRAQTTSLVTIGRPPARSTYSGRDVGGSARDVLWAAGGPSRLLQRYTTGRLRYASDPELSFVATTMPSDVEGRAYVVEAGRGTLLVGLNGRGRVCWVESFDLWRVSAPVRRTFRISASDD